MNTIRDKQSEIDENNKIKVRKLEEFYVNGTVSDLIPELNKQKEKMVEKMIEYAEDNKTACKWDKDGCPIDYTVEIKPIVINNYFFKSIVPLGSKIPAYSAEQIAMAFDYYMDIITNINVHIGNYPTSLTTFCKFLGISMSTLRNYRNSEDMDMRNIVEKIYDQIGEENLTMSQMGVAKEKSTLFRLKTQNEIVEKATPNVNITYKTTIDKDALENKLDKYKALLNKKEE